IEEQRLRSHLNDVDHVVVAADVCQFVSEHSIELRRRQPEDRCWWQQDERTQPPDGTCAFRAARCRDLDITTDPHACGQSRGALTQDVVDTLSTSPERADFEAACDESK